jgi:hypothetical protein
LNPVRQVMRLFQTVMACLWALSCTAAAAEPVPAARGFDAIDSNHDGVIEEIEAAFEPALWAEFRRADADRNLRISRQEFERWRARSIEHVKLGPRLLLPPEKQR